MSTTHRHGEQEALATLRGIATYAAAARDDLAAHGSDPTALGVLDTIATEARRVSWPAPSSSATERIASRPQFRPGPRSATAAGRLTVATCIEYLEGEAPAFVERTQIGRLLTMVAGAEAADDLLRSHSRRAVRHAELRTVRRGLRDAIATDLRAIAAEVTA